MDFGKLANIQQSIAADVWPHGAVLECAECGHLQRITTEQAGVYLRSGWPRHCKGQTMRLSTLSAPASTSVTEKE